MMKRMIAGGLLAAGIFMGCLEVGAASAEPVQAEKGKVAVIFFSWSADGNTRFAAERIAAKAGAKLYEIKAEKPYNTNYRACCDEAKPECHGKLLRPIRKIDGLDLAKFDVVFVGTPNWWGTMAPPVRTFLMQNASALKGKTLCVFQTNGGGGMQRVAKEFAEIFPDSKILPAQAFTGKLVRKSVKALDKFVTDRVTLK
ncbi:MAG: NAD(P)H-dependent oxidoreductase [Lentisphaeria bacterium]|nr:NAD(P)H-dependent oxidoreductase [Lentisphaeria bacterium]